MDRPRSPVQDAGRWVRSIRRCGRDRQWRNTKSGAASPHLGETAPLVVASYSVVSGGPPSRPCCRRAALLATRFGLLPPVHRLFQPVRYGRQLAIMIVAEDHLLDVVMVMVVGVDADVMPVADGFAVPAADVGNGSGNWDKSLSPYPVSRHPLRHRDLGDDGVARPNHSVPASARDCPMMVKGTGLRPQHRLTPPHARRTAAGEVLRGPSRSVRETHCAQGRRCYSGRRIMALARGTFRPGLESAETGRVGRIRRTRLAWRSRRQKLAGASGSSGGGCRGWADTPQRDRARRSWLLAPAAG